jgi:uncharacterized protein YbaA (DUF1428 family)
LGCGTENRHLRQRLGSQANVDRYREIATTAGELSMEHGALSYKERRV